MNKIKLVWISKLSAVCPGPPLAVYRKIWGLTKASTSWMSFMKEPNRKVGPNALMSAGTMEAWYFCLPRPPALAPSTKSTLPAFLLKDALGPATLHAGRPLALSVSHNLLSAWSKDSYPKYTQNSLTARTKINTTCITWIMKTAINISCNNKIPDEATYIIFSSHAYRLTTM